MCRSSHVGAQEHGEGNRFTACESQQPHRTSKLLTEGHDILTAWRLPSCHQPAARFTNALCRLQRETDQLVGTRGTTFLNSIYWWEERVSLHAPGRSGSRATTTATTVDPTKVICIHYCDELGWWSGGVKSLAQEAIGLRYL